MVKGDGEWLPAALALERRLAALPRGAQRAAYDEAVADRGLSRQTLRRMVAAARYVRSIAKSVAMAPEDVRAAVVTVEALMRLEKRDPRVAASMRRAVLEGRSSFRSVLALLDGGERRAAAAPERDWDAFALMLADNAFEVVDAVGFGPDRAWASDVARELKVDMEVDERGTRWAVFLSPECEFSEFRGRAPSEQIPRLFMALFFYERVLFCYEREAEAVEVERFRSLGGAGTERLELFDLPLMRRASSEERSTPE